MKYEPVIGLEVHAQLLTKSKMFCGCSAEVFGAAPNTHVCPVCLGMPGTLPVINQTAVEYTIMTALALHCEIPEFAKFDRKNYHYPDLMKGYQISQYDLPLSRNGWVSIAAWQQGSGSAEGTEKRIGIRRVHLEEDTAKLFHVDGQSLVDVNRSGVPLMEIVSEPDLHSVEDVRAYCLKLRQILRYLSVSSGDMEKGAMRFEANISLRPAGTTELSETRVEVKNLNSFRAVLHAVEYEIARQAKILDAGGRVEQETMGWDEARNVTVSQRSKEEAHDYRYFPEPDLPRLQIARAWVEAIRAQLPELPDEKIARFEKVFGLSAYDAGVLAAERNVADYFERAVVEGKARGVEPKALSNWITSELFALMKDANAEIDAVMIAPARLADLAALVQTGTISSTIGKKVLGAMFTTGRDPRQIVVEQNLAQVSDRGAIEAIVVQVLAANESAVREYLGGKEQTLKFLVGQVMRASQGKANPARVNEILIEKLERMK